LLEVLVTKLTGAASFMSQTVIPPFELILSEFAKYDAVRLVRLLLPYIKIDTLGTDGGASAAATIENVPIPSLGDNPKVRLLALHVVSASVRFLPSSQLLSLLPALAAVAIPTLSSPLIELRKAVIFVLVEAYLAVGDALFPHIASLEPPQRKLLTIYAEKKMAERKQAMANKRL
jgi:hypothetical protein